MKRALILALVFALAAAIFFVLSSSQGDLTPSVYEGY
jgi:hypothetical protein